MFWEMLGAVGDFLSGIGVLITLIYLAYQVRQHTLTQKNESRREVMKEMTDWYSTVMTQPHLMTVWNKTLVSNESLSPEERAWFTWMIVALTSRFETIYSQYKFGLVERALWIKYRGTMSALLHVPAIREMWDSGAAVFPDDFRNEIDSTPENEKNWAPVRQMSLAMGVAEIQQGSSRPEPSDV
jgi:hypothetical protein